MKTTLLLLLITLIPATTAYAAPSPGADIEMLFEGPQGSGATFGVGRGDFTACSNTHWVRAVSGASAGLPETTVNGQPNQWVMHFTDTDHFIHCGNDGVNPPRIEGFPLQYPGDATFSFDLNVSNGQGIEVLFWGARWNAADLNRFQIYLDGNKLNFDYKSPTGVIHAIFGGVVLPRGEWIRVTIQRDASDPYAHIYTLLLNGVEFLTATDPSPHLPNNDAWAICGRNNYRCSSGLMMDSVTYTASIVAPPAPPNEWPDSDGDGINDDVDRCPHTPTGRSVIENGCDLATLAREVCGDPDENYLFPGRCTVWADCVDNFLALSYHRAAFGYECSPQSPDVGHDVQIFSYEGQVCNNLEYCGGPWY